MKTVTDQGRKLPVFCMHNRKKAGNSRLKVRSFSGVKVSGDTFELYTEYRKKYLFRLQKLAGFIEGWREKDIQRRIEIMIA